MTRSFVAFTLLCACSSDPSAPPPPAVVGGTDSGTSPTPSPPSTDEFTVGADYEGQLDPAIPHAKEPAKSRDGCLLKGTQFVSGKIAKSDGGGGGGAGVAWTTPENALALDQKYAEVTLNDGEESQTLRISDFGFAIPADIVTWGVEFELTRQAPQGGIADVRVDFDFGDLVAAKFTFLEGLWPVSAVGKHIYGQATENWGIDLLPTSVSQATFTAKLKVKKVGNVAGPVVAKVDAIRVSTWFCPRKK